MEEKILKHRFGSGGVVSPNQGVDKETTVCVDQMKVRASSASSF